MKLQTSLFIFLVFANCYTGLSSLTKSSANSESSSKIQDASYAMMESEVAQINNKQLLSQDAAGNNSGDVVMDRDTSNTAIIVIMITLVIILIVFLVVKFKTKRQAGPLGNNLRNDFVAAPQNEPENDTVPINANPEEFPRSSPTNRNNPSNYGTFTQT